MRVRRGGDARFKDRNPRPARGPEVLSLVQLRHYVNLFWTDRRYGICHIRGGKAAFLRFCGERLTHHIQDKLLDQDSEYFPADLQRQLSKKIQQVLRGQIIFVPVNDGQATWKPLLSAPQPPLDDGVPFYDHQFRIEHTALGPRIRKI